MHVHYATEIDLDAVINNNISAPRTRRMLVENILHWSLYLYEPWFDMDFSLKTHQNQSAGV